MRSRPWMPVVASAAAYIALTAIVGRDVLAGISTTIAHDAGDPVFTASLLYWNATQVPLSDAWWQLPIFYPTPDALTFSEHLLGLSVIATPLYWLTRDPLVTYNVAMLATFPLCALAMYALVRRLTGSAAAAFVAGLAFGFAPYRMGQLSHIQVLAVFWAPLALLGLHAYIETGRRRWLVLYSGAWLLQTASNAYMLVLLSLLIGLWVLWFVVARRQWRALGRIAAATAIAGIPLVPILYGYVTVHARHGFVRSLDEMREFSADVVSVLCAPEGLAFWGWLRVQCGREAELFPGLAVLALGVIGLVLVLQSGSGEAGCSPPGRPQAVLRRLNGFVRRGLILVAGVYAAIVIGVITSGPWRLDLGVLRMSATSVEKPLAICAAAILGWVVLAPGVRAAARGSSLVGFYVVASILAWILALGPTLIVMGRRLSVDAPFALLAALPGVDGLRVPARFWLLAVLCLAVAAGVVLAHLLRGRSRRASAAACGFVTILLLADGWTQIPAVAVPPQAPAPQALAGQVVLEVPVRDGVRDIAAQYRAVLGGWKAVNGYSGYFPSYYPALGDALMLEEDSALVPFQRRNELHVIVHHDAPGLRALVERQPGAIRVAEGVWATQYRLPRRPQLQEAAPRGRRLPVVHVQSECSPADLGYAIDGNERSRWRCDMEEEWQTLTIDLGDVMPVDAVVHRIGPYSWEFPKHLLIQTSEDGETWRDAWNGSVLKEVIEGGLADPASLSVVLPFSQRPTRYLRIRHRNFETGVGWTVAEIEVWSGAEPEDGW